MCARRSSDQGRPQQGGLPFESAETPRHDPLEETGSPAAVSAAAARGGFGDRRPAGHPFVAQLARLCLEYPTREKWVIVPAHAVGHTIGDRLAREGTSWANLRFVTPLDLAIRMAGPHLVERGIDPSEDALGPALIMGLLLDLERGLDAPDRDARPPHFPNEPSGYFRPMAEHTTLAVTLWRTLREIRLAGLRAAGLPREAFDSAGKHAEMAALVDAYERHLDTHRLADAAVVFEEAAAHLEFCPIGPPDVRVELPDIVWPLLVRRFLDALPGDRLVAQTIDLPGLLPPRRVAWLAAPADRVEPSPAGDASRLRWLCAPQAAGPPSGDRTLEVCHAGGRESEMEEVLRRVFASGRPLDQVEIACASDAHALLAWEKARRLDWPVTISAGIPAATTRPGRALLAWCAWIEGDFTAADLRRLLQSGDVAPTAWSQPARWTREPRPAGVSRLPDAGRTHGAREPRDGEWRGSLAPGQAARLLLRAEAAWGRRTYDRALSAFAARAEARARTEGQPPGGWRWQRASQARQLLAWIEDLLAAVPEADARGLIALDAMVDAAAAFVEDNASRAGDINAAACVALRDGLDALRECGVSGGPRALALRLVREVVESVRVGGSRARPGHLHVSALASAGYDARPLVFVVGLEEARVFAGATEDPVLLDVERERLNDLTGRPHALRTSRDVLDESVFTIVSRLAAMGVDCGAQAGPVAVEARHELAAEPAPASAALSGRGGAAPAAATALPGPASHPSPPAVVLSFSCRDTREFRDSFPSWLVLHGFRLAGGSADAGHDDLRTWLGEPASPVPRAPAAALTDAGWWLSAGRAGDAVAPGVVDAFPGIGRGAAAARLRALDAFGEFDGLVAAAGAALDPSRNGQAIAPTTLEDASACAFRFFLRRGLGLEAIEEAGPDADVWLDPLTRGAELHELYATLMRRARDAGRRVTRALDREWFLACGRQRLDEIAREMPPPSEEVHAAEAAELLADLDAFVEAEASQAGTTPIAFEVGFGRPLEGAVEGLARDEPVPLDLGAGRHLRLAGRIDRIDRIGPHDYQVVDYKTGRFWRDAFAGRFAGGTLLQHALYGRAAEALLAAIDARARVSRGVYWFSTSRGWGRRVAIAAPATAALRRVLGDLLDVLGAGAFTQTPVARTCEWCDVKAACGRAPWAAAERKIAANAGGRLTAWIRLKEHE
jgi:hypothetical protein